MEIQSLVNAFILLANFAVLVVSKQFMKNVQIISLFVILRE